MRVQGGAACGSRHCQEEVDWNIDSEARELETFFWFPYLPFQIAESGKCEGARAMGNEGETPETPIPDALKIETRGWAAESGRTKSKTDCLF